jgi:hypothetical protein
MGTNRPVKWADYYELPWRDELAQELMGMYNTCFGYQDVARTVARMYRDADHHLRAEMVTASVIAHRNKRMLDGREGFDLEDATSIIHDRIKDLDIPILYGGYVIER